MSENATILQLKDVAKRYDAVGPTSAKPVGRTPASRVAPPAGAYVLRGINLDVAAGESLAIVGPSGSGKSTLLNLIGGLDRPTAGQVLLEGRDLAALSERQLAAVRATQIGFVFQLHHLLPQCTALENVLVPVLALPGRGGVAQARPWAEELLRRVGLAERMNYRPGQLSGGECQRVAVVRALINRPRLLLADEPTGSLDRHAADALADLLVELNRQEHVTLIAVTHSPSVASRMSRVLELSDGLLKDSGVARASCP